MSEVKAELYTYEDCLPESHALDWNDRVLVLNPKCLAESYRKPEFQLWRGDGGFGCKPHTLGTAVFAVRLADDERERWRRGDFLGVLKPELIPESISRKA